MLLSCPYCGTVQAAGGAARASLACCVCHMELERTTGRSLDAALACCSAVLLPLLPANTLPFLTTTLLGASRHSRLYSSATAMWSDGWPLLGIVIGLFVVVAPLLRFSVLTAVLGALRLGRRPPWLGPAFRFANRLQTWAMPDVFLLGLWVAYARLASTISVEVGVGAKCFIAAGVLTLFTRAVLDKREVWRAIAPQPPVALGQPVLSCEACELIVPATHDGRDCPRCSARLHARKPEAAGRAAALTLAGLVMYIPANLYAIATIPIGLTPTRYTVLEGVKDLVQSNLWGLALLVFSASFAIPFLKLAGLSWCIASVLRRSSKRLVFKTRLFQLVEEIGRWSMVDPFVISCFVPVMGYNALIFGRAEPAAPAFTAVVVLTITAARAFDPRRMWDVARTRA